MVNNIPVGVIKQAAAVGFHWQGKHNQQRLTALSKKCQLRVQYLFFPRKCHSKCQLLLFSVLKRRKVFQHPFRSTTDTISDSISKKLHCHWQNKVELCRPDKSLGRLGWRCWLSEKKRNTTQPCEIYWFHFLTSKLREKKGRAQKKTEKS